MPTKVSVIVPTHDRPAMLREALASVRAIESDDLKFEVIVADNGREPAESVAAEYGARWIRVREPGASPARNAGLKAATGQFVAFLDDDDLWLPEHIRPHVEALRRDDSLAAVSAQLRLTDATVSDTSPPWPTDVPTDGDLYPTLLRTQIQIGVTLARTCVRETVGYFDNELTAGQDWDWQLRLALRHRVGFLPVPVMLFRMRPPTADVALNVVRARFARRILWRNYRRAGRRRPSILQMLRIDLMHMGRYVDHILSGVAAGHGRRRESSTLLFAAFRISPLHTVLGVVRRPQIVRRLVASA